MTEWVNTNKHYANENAVLHTEETCMFVSASSTPAEDAPVDPDALDVCQWCSGEIDRVQDQDMTCPFCEDTVGALPDHLPCEASP